jgi:hypothetical protein
MNNRNDKQSPLESLMTLHDIVMAFMGRRHMEERVALWNHLKNLAERETEKAQAKKSGKNSRRSSAGLWAERYARGEESGEIIYACSNYKVVKVLMVSNGLLVKKTLSGDLKALTALLEDQGIIRTHASFCIQKAHAIGVDNEYVYMDNMHKVRWSRKYRNSNMRFLLDLRINPQTWPFDKKDFIECTVNMSKTNF